LQAGPAQETGANEHVQGEVLVGLKPGLAAWARNNIAFAVGGSVLSSNDDINVIRVKVAASGLDNVIRALERNPNVEFAEPNFIASAADAPSDPYFSYQWDLERVRAPEAWAVTTGSTAIQVAILDTGIEANHPDLSGKVVVQKNLSGSPTVTDVAGHGTHVAGIVGATTNNGEGVASLSYGVSLMNVKVLGDGGSGSYSALADGITWAARNGADVINMSLGGAASSKTLERAINMASRNGVIMIAAAGNNGSTTPYYPAAYDKVIAVASTDYSDQLSPYSNRGEWVAVAAPGGPIWSTLNDGSYGF
jgi:thermitase